MELNEAVEQAITECIREGILSELLSRNRAEVLKVSIFEYDQELEEKKYREAEYEHGRQDGYDAGIQEGRTAGIREGIETGRTAGIREGRAAGIREGIERGVEQGSIQTLVNQVCSKLRKGKTPEEIADALEASVENIQKICRTAEQYAPKYPAEEVCRDLMNKKI